MMQHILYSVPCWQLEVWTHITYAGGVGCRVGSGWVGSDFSSAIAVRVGLGRVNVSPGRVGSKKSDPWTTLGKHSTTYDLFIHLPWCSYTIITTTYNNDNENNDDNTDNDDYDSDNDDRTNILLEPRYPGSWPSH